MIAPGGTPSAAAFATQNVQRHHPARAAITQQQKQARQTAARCRISNVPSSASSRPDPAHTAQARCGGRRGGPRASSGHHGRRGNGDDEGKPGQYQVVGQRRGLDGADQRLTADVIEACTRAG